MIQFNSSKLHTTFLSDTNEWSPVHGRKLTLTHSDESGDLFLSIGRHYNMLAIDRKKRDEVLGEWKQQHKQFVFIGKVYVSGGEFDEQSSQKRFMIFQKELKLALTGIFYGDYKFLRNYPTLLNSPIFVHFQSIFPQYNQELYYGSPSHYLNPN